jgi:hypothetical protein
MGNRELRGGHQIMPIRVACEEIQLPGVQASGLRTRVVVRHSTGSQTINVESFLLLPRRWHGEQEAARARNMCWYSTSIFKSASSAEVRKVSVLRLYRLHYYLAYDSVSSSYLERRLEGISSSSTFTHIAR